MNIQLGNYMPIFYIFLLYIEISKFYGIFCISKLSYHFFQIIHVKYNAITEAIRGQRLVALVVSLRTQGGVARTRLTTERSRGDTVERLSHQLRHRVNLRSDKHTTFLVAKVHNYFRNCLDFVSGLFGNKLSVYLRFF